MCMPLSVGEAAQSAQARLTEGLAGIASISTCSARWHDSCSLGERAVPSIRLRACHALRTALPASPRHLASTPEIMCLVKSMLPQPCEWAGFGAGRHSFTMLAQAFILGGHCRIGMEDTVHLARGNPTPSNAALVEKSVRIIEDLGGKIATVAEARQLLGLSPRPR